MKAIKYLAFVSIFTLGVSACRADLLDTSAYDGVGSTNVWSSTNLATMAVNGVYNTFLQSSGEVQNAITGGNYLGLDAYIFAALDPTVSTRQNHSSTLSLLNGTASSSKTEFSRAWKQHYEGISRANDVIDNVETVPNMDPALCARYIAEAKFLRAYFYYRLNCLYRGVPLYLKSTNVTDYTKPRNTEEEVWNAIIKDLTDAINEKNLPDIYLAEDPNYGRVTKGAAYALRGKVYLWLNKYELAESDLTTVGTLGYSLYDGSYRDLFKEANEQCPEMVFSIQCYEQDGYGHSMTFKYGSRVSYPGGWNDFYGDTDFIDTYETKEGKPFKWDDYLPGYSTMTPEERAVFFLRDGLNSGKGNFGSAKYKSLKEAAEKDGADFSEYLDQGNEARIRKVYEDRDPRLMQTYITPYSEYVGSPHTAGGKEYTYTLRWPFIENDIQEPYDLRSDTKDKFHYLVRKFVSEGTEHLDRSYSPLDVPLIRYADVLLSLAEAINEQNRTSEAVTYVNMVRGRAGVALLNNGNQYTQVKGQADMRERIRREKRWELACEGTLYFDELRWGTWYDSKLFDGAGLKECWGQTVVSWTNTVTYYNTWPIPATERQLNSNLTQNDGWID